jgi:hypothetical protein
LAVPRLEKTAKTPSSSTSLRVSWTVCAGLYASSYVRYEILRPWTPPLAFTWSKYARAPAATVPKAAASPVSGTVPPRRTLVGVTPGSAAEPAPADAASASAVTTAAASLTC